VSDTVAITHANPPARPTQNDEAVLRFAAEKLADTLRDECSEFEEFDRDDMIADLAHALRYESYDGYALARELDRRHGWDIKASAVEILDGWHTYEALREFERGWVKAYGVTPKLPLGAAVTYSTGVKTHTGTIVKIESHVGHYIVGCPTEGHSGTGGYVVAFEVIESQNAALLGSEGR
jgi:hypothetical protein